MIVSKRIDIPLLIIDILLIVFANLVSRYLFTEQDIIHHWERRKLFALFAATVFTVSWYLGYQYAIFFSYYGKLVSNIVMCFFALIILVMVIYMFRIFLIMMDNMDASTTKQAIGFSATLIFVGPVMSISGYLTGKKTGKGTYELKKSDGYSDWQDELFDLMDISGASVVSVIIVFVMTIGVMIWLLSYQFVSDHDILIVFVFLGSVVISCGIFCVFIWLRFLFRKTILYNPVATLCFNLTPVVIVAMLTIWMDIELAFTRGDFGSSAKIPTGGLFVLLLITGLLPFRIIMLFSPPFKLINFFTGLIALSYFVFKVAQLS